MAYIDATKAPVFDVREQIIANAHALYDGKVKTEGLWTYDIPGGGAARPHFDVIICGEGFEVYAAVIAFNVEPKGRKTIFIDSRHTNSATRALELLLEATMWMLGGGEMGRDVQCYKGGAWKNIGTGGHYVVPEGT